MPSTPDEKDVYQNAVRDIIKRHPKSFSIPQADFWLLGKLASGRHDSVGPMDAKTAQEWLIIDGDYQLFLKDVEAAELLMAHKFLQIIRDIKPEIARNDDVLLSFFVHLSRTNPQKTGSAAMEWGNPKEFVAVKVPLLQ